MCLLQSEAARLSASLGRTCITVSGLGGFFNMTSPFPSSTDLSRHDQSHKCARVGSALVSQPPAHFLTHLSHEHQPQLSSDQDRNQ